MPKPKATYCRFHCRACDTHYTSLEAFDAHRRGSHDKNTRYCRPPSMIRKGSHALTELRGVCRISDPTKPPRTHVWVWQLARSEGVEAVPQTRLDKKSTA